MPKFILTILALLIFASAIAAQDFEYGTTAELKGLTKVHIDVGPDVDNFERIKKVIEKAKLDDLTIVANRDDADFAIFFRGAREQVLVGRATHLKAVGKGYVVMPSVDGKRGRILMNFESMQDKIGEDKPATRLAKDFVKAYKKANDIK
ncbi:MAG: hypothetical protein ABL984_06890 [Pyrinomonadaceae bacterium]